MLQFTVHCFNTQVYCEQFSNCLTCSLFSFTRSEGWGKQLLYHDCHVLFPGQQGENSTGCFWSSLSHSRQPNSGLSLACSTVPMLIRTLEPWIRNLWRRNDTSLTPLCAMDTVLLTLPFAHLYRKDKNL